MRKPAPGPRVRKNGLQNADLEWCWATTCAGKPCHRRAQGSNLPYCKTHLESGNPILKIKEHPTAGKIVVAGMDLPKGYRMVYWGARRRWRDTNGGEDRAMCFKSGGGVIDPYGIDGAQLQFMSCPGPNERCNTRATSHYFGATYEKGCVGREFMTMEPIKKNHQLLQWYGPAWFSARGIDRQDVGTKRWPAVPKRKSPSDSENPTTKTAADGAKTVKGAGGTEKSSPKAKAKKVLGDLTNTGRGGKGRAVAC